MSGCSQGGALRMVLSGWCSQGGAAGSATLTNPLKRSILHLLGTLMACKQKLIHGWQDGEYRQFPCPKSRPLFRATLEDGDSRCERGAINSMNST